MNPLVSVIVPVYKAEKYVYRCLDSIVAQTFSDFEVILVDDGSPDKCGEICDEYAAKDNRFRVIHQENHGVSVARQVGLDAAIGRQRLLFESLVIDELGLVDQEPRKGQRVAAARAILRNDDGAGAVVEGNDMLILRRLDDWLAEGFRRPTPNDVVDAIHEAPSFPCRQQARNCVGQAMLVGGHNNTASAARHALHVAQHKWRGY